jgi:hypothetical protein
MIPQYGVYIRVPRDLPRAIRLQFGYRRMVSQKLEPFVRVQVGLWLCLFGCLTHGSSLILLFLSAVY